jgi:hypothetical protein
VSPTGLRQRTRARHLLFAVVAGLAVVAPTPLGSPEAYAAVLDPVARWTFDEGSGMTVGDAIGSADGTMAGGATWITSDAAVGAGAIHFDGVDGRVDVPYDSALEPNELALSFRVRGSPDDPPAHGQVIVEKGAFGCDGPSWGVRVAGNGLSLVYRDFAGNPSSGFGSSPRCGRTCGMGRGTS